MGLFDKVNKAVDDKINTTKEYMNEVPKSRGTEAMMAEKEHREAAKACDVYKVVQMTFHERLFGVQSKEIRDMEILINSMWIDGYVLEKMNITETSSQGLAGGDLKVATMVFIKKEFKI